MNDYDANKIIKKIHVNQVTEYYLSYPYII